jgi:hypothetical protein
MKRQGKFLRIVLAAANNPQSPHYIPPANRIAVFRKGGAIRGAFVG